MPPVYDSFADVYRKLGATVNRPLHRETFRLDGRDFSYVVQPYNRTWRNERIVELAVAQDALARHRGRRILEVGNVMVHYGHTGHDVVDLYEQGAGVRNVDVLDFHPETPYDLIVSISTLEHVGFDEDGDIEPDKPVRAVEHMRSLLAPGGELLVTVPLGYNLDLDLALREGSFGFDTTGYLMRVSKFNRWKQVGAADVRKARYGTPYRAANAIAVATNVAPAG